MPCGAVMGALPPGPCGNVCSAASRRPNSASGARQLSAWMLVACRRACPGVGSWPYLAGSGFSLTTVFSKVCRCCAAIWDACM